MNHETTTKQLKNNNEYDINHSDDPHLNETKTNLKSITPNLNLMPSREDNNLNINNSISTSNRIITQQKEMDSNNNNNNNVKYNNVSDMNFNSMVLPNLNFTNDLFPVEELIQERKSENGKEKEQEEEEERYTNEGYKEIERYEERYEEVEKMKYEDFNYSRETYEGSRYNEQIYQNERYEKENEEKHNNEGYEKAGRYDEERYDEEDEVKRYTEERFEEERFEEERFEEDQYEEGKRYEEEKYEQSLEVKYLEERYKDSENINERYNKDAHEEKRYEERVYEGEERRKNDLERYKESNHIDERQGEDRYSEDEDEEYVNEAQEYYLNESNPNFEHDIEGLKTINIYEHDEKNHKEYYLNESNQGSEYQLNGLQTIDNYKHEEINHQEPYLNQNNQNFKHNLQELQSNNNYNHEDELLKTNIEIDITDLSAAIKEELNIIQSNVEQDPLLTETQLSMESVLLPPGENNSLDITYSQFAQMYLGEEEENNEIINQLNESQLTIDIENLNLGVASPSHAEFHSYIEDNDEFLGDEFLKTIEIDGNSINLDENDREEDNYNEVVKYNHEFDSNNYEDYNNNNNNNELMNNNEVIFNESSLIVDDKHEINLKDNNIILIDEIDGKQGVMSIKSELCDSGTLSSTKHWKQYYVLLIEATLLIFKLKEKKEYKFKGWYDLAGATIFEADKTHSKKNNVFFIKTQSNLNPLFLTEDLIQFNDWFKAIKDHINAFNLNHKKSKFIQIITKLNRNHNLKFIAKQDVISNNSLTTSLSSPKSNDDIKLLRNNKTKSNKIIGKLFHKSSISTSSIPSNTNKEMFFTDSDSVWFTLIGDSDHIAYVPKRCIEELNSRNCFNCQGIYRLSGNSKQIKDWKLKFINIGPVSLASEPDINTITGILKLYFRELTEPLIPFIAYDNIIETSRIQDYNERLMGYKDIILEQLSKEQLNTLKFLIEHLKMISEYSEENLMDANNLAIVFGPTIARPKDNNLHPQLQPLYMLVESLILQFDWFFDLDV